MAVNKDQEALSVSGSSWQTIASSTSATETISQTKVEKDQEKEKDKPKKSRRPTDPEDEFFNEQAKFFRHIERRYNRFNKTFQEDEKRARQGKLKSRKSKDQDKSKEKKDGRQRDGRGDKAEASVCTDTPGPIPSD